MASAPDRHRIRRPLLAPAVLAVLVGATLVAHARGETPSGRYATALDRTVRFLQEDQNRDGGFGGEAGSPSDPDFSSWVALALAAAGVNPHDQAKPGGVDVYSYLAAHAAELTFTTDFERALLVVNASEYPPRPLGGVNLVEAILASRLPSGAFSHEAGGIDAGMNDTIFAILALSPIKEPAIEKVVHEAAEWVIAEQNSNHSWPSWCPKTVAGCSPPGQDPQDSTDMTGAALEALNAAGMHDTEAQERALEYLHETQLPDGGWAQAIGEGESNVGSTAWVAQGIWAGGGNPEDWVKDGVEPLGYLASMQQADGHIRYMESQELNGVWMTSYVTPAMSGQPLPIAPAVLSPPAEEPQEPEEPPVFVETPGGEGTGSSGDPGFKQGEGVIAGGGGHGAPLFSRPKARSKGRTPGGARIVRGKGLHARDHSHNRRGANRHQARGTEKREPRHAAAAEQELAAVSATAVTGGKGGGGGNEGSGPGERGAPLPVKGSPREGATTTGEEVSGVVVGSPEGGHGKLAFGAPGLRSGGGAGAGLGTAIGVGIAALVAAGLGVGLERRRGSLA